MFARQQLFVEMVAAVGTHIAVTGKQLGVGEAGVQVEGVDGGHALGADDAVHGDDGLHPRDRVVPAMEHRHLGTKLPAHVLRGIVDHSVFE